jgi:hypothetical protein
MKSKPDDHYTEEEANRRFEALVRSALNTPPAPMKDRPTKRSESKGVARRATKASS